MREAAANAGLLPDDLAGIGDRGGWMLAEVVFQGGGVLLEGVGAPRIVPPLQGLETPIAELVEPTLHAGTRQSAQADDVGPGKSVGREAKNFHPHLNLRTRMVETIVVDLFENRRREFERTHGILPRESDWETKATPYPASRKDQSLPREAYYISSLPAEVKRIAAAVRGHWGIENGLHWVLDVAFREDRNRTRAKNAQANLGILRRTALSLLKNTDGLKGSMHCRRQQAAWNDATLENILFGCQGREV